MEAWCWRWRYGHCQQPTSEKQTVVKTTEELQSRQEMAAPLQTK